MSGNGGKPAAVNTLAGKGWILGPVDTTVVVVPEKLSRIGPLKKPFFSATLLYRSQSVFYSRWCKGQQNMLDDVLARAWK